jgi:hypothetical protein
MSRHGLDDDISSFAGTDEPEPGLVDDESCVLHVTITMELPGGCGVNTLPLTAAADILERLERDGLRPYRTVIEVTEKTTR